ncbi:unnamed protein product [Pleuronectes platessa]|uniref:Uncharacterized protein n=1 Tax=Pleuronectes platessa TaxID=8262 RepID=A0A9N7Z367_PLEPL|nr:unnamed protein product [Pleuronectes platessa]
MIVEDEKETEKGSGTDRRRIVVLGGARGRRGKGALRKMRAGGVEGCEPARLQELRVRIQMSNWVRPTMPQWLVSTSDGVMSDKVPLVFREKQHSSSATHQTHIEQPAGQQSKGQTSFFRLQPACSAAGSVLTVKPNHTFCHRFPQKIRDGLPPSVTHRLRKLSKQINDWERKEKGGEERREKEGEK